MRRRCYSRIETAELLSNLEKSSQDRRSAELANSHEVLVLCPSRLGVSSNTPLQHIELCLHLLLSGSRVHLGQDSSSLVNLASLDEVARGFGEEKLDDDALDQGRDAAQGDGPPPACANVGKASADGSGNDLSTSDGDDVEGDEAAADAERGDFRDEDGRELTGSADSDTHDEAADDEGPFGRDGGLDDCACDEEDVAEDEGPLAAEFVGQVAWRAKGEEDVSVSLGRNAVRAAHSPIKMAPMMAPTARPEVMSSLSPSVSFLPSMSVPTWTRTELMAPVSYPKRAPETAEMAVRVQMYIEVPDS